MSRHSGDVHSLAEPEPAPVHELDGALAGAPHTQGTAVVDALLKSSRLESPPILSESTRDAINRRMLAAADAIAAGTALLVTMSLFSHHGRSDIVTLALVPLIVLMSKIIGLYDREELIVRKSTLDEAPKLFQLATLWALIVWLTNAFVIVAPSGRRELVVLWLGLFLLLLIMRSAARMLSRLVTPPERCLVIGDGRTCEQVRRKLAGKHSLHARVVAHVSLGGGAGGDGPALAALSHSGDLKALASQYRVDRILLTPERADGEDVLDLIRAGTSMGLKVSVVPRILEVVGSSVEFDDVEGVPLLSIRHARLSWSSQIVKRTLDLIVSGAATLIFLPLMAVIAVAIKLDSKGPVLFRQLRVGRDGRTFEMLKFRTMIDGAHAQREGLHHLNETVGLFKIADDPRITRVGSLLRRTSLDELPQLWNVVRGDMSLVGPRPLVVEEDRRIEGWHRRRLQLTPGMTGHWQILGSARIPLDEMVKIDYLYVTNWSLWQDIKILLRTIPYVVGRRGM